MSEYQYYEFQAIDRPLTIEEQRTVSNLSSRVDPHPRRAIFVYHYTRLPADAKELLALTEVEEERTRKQLAAEADARLGHIRAAYPRRRALLERLDKAGLP